MRVSFVSIGDNFLNMGDRKISMAFTYVSANMWFTI